MEKHKAMWNSKTTNLRELHNGRHPVYENKHTRQATDHMEEWNSHQRNASHEEKPEINPKVYFSMRTGTTIEPGVRIDDQTEK